MVSIKFTFFVQFYHCIQFWKAKSVLKSKFYHRKTFNCQPDLTIRCCLWNSRHLRCTFFFRSSTYSIFINRLICDVADWKTPQRDKCLQPELWSSSNSYTQTLFNHIIYVWFYQMFKLNVLNVCFLHPSSVLKAASSRRHTKFRRSCENETNQRNPTQIWLSILWVLLLQDGVISHFYFDFCFPSVKKCHKSFSFSTSFDLPQRIRRSGSYFARNL